MRVLLLTPTTFGYERRTREAVQRIGHEVAWLDERIGNDMFSKAATRLGLLRFTPWLVRRHVERIIKRALQFGAERLLVINPETLDGAAFSRIKAVLPEMDIVIYRWDSFRQKPIDEATMALASAIYSFDPEDCARDPRLRHLPLFHNYEAPPAPRDISKARYEFSFVGTVQLRRIRILGRMCQALNSAGRSYFFYLTAPSIIHLVFAWVAARVFGYTGRLTQTRLPYERFLEVIASSRGVVDIEFKRQSGLTMRTFEVVFSGMPLLTTNARILRYDFSVDAPVYLFDEESGSWPDIAGFVGAGIDAYFEKYAIDTWARTLMNKEIHGYFRDTASTSLSIPERWATTRSNSGN